MASRPSYRPGKPKLSRYGISKAPSSVNISAAFFGSRNDAAVNSFSSSFAFFMCDPFCHGNAVSGRGRRPSGHSRGSSGPLRDSGARARRHPQCAPYPLRCRSEPAGFAVLVVTPWTATSHSIVGPQQLRAYRSTTLYRCSSVGRGHVPSQGLKLSAVGACGGVVARTREAMRPRAAVGELSAPEQLAQLVAWFEAAHATYRRRADRAATAAEQNLLPANARASRATGKIHIC